MWADPEYKARRIATHKHNKHTPESLANLRTAKLGHAVSPETRMKIAESLRGRRLSQARRASISAGLRSPGAHAKYPTAYRQKICSMKRPDVRERHLRAMRSVEVRAKMSRGISAAYRRPEVLAKVSGPNASNWQGGKSFEPYSPSWGQRLRHQIRERDGFVCRMPRCGVPPGRRPHPVHHIDYDKKNCHPDNLITLCLKCHGLTGSNRAYWKSLLASVVREKALPQGQMELF